MYDNRERKQTRLVCSLFPPWHRYKIQNGRRDIGVYDSRPGIQRISKVHIFGLLILCNCKTRGDILLSIWSFARGLTLLLLQVKGGKRWSDVMVMQCDVVNQGSLGIIRVTEAIKLIVLMSP